MGSPLLLDNNPDPLVVGYVTLDGWTQSLDYYNAADALAPWPAAPVLVFLATGLFSVTASLTNTSSRATWTLTPLQVAALHASDDKRVRLVVAGVTWFAGLAAQRA